MIGLADMALLLVALVLSRYAYFGVPAGVAAVYFGFRSKPLCALLALAQLLALLLLEKGSDLFWIVNGVATGLVVVALAVRLAQYGSRARDVAVLAGALAVYDVLAGPSQTLDGDAIRHPDGLGFPGIEALLVAALFPVVARKAFGREAGALALIGSLLACVAAWAAGVRPLLVLAPVIVIQYACWGLNRRERSTLAYLCDELDPGPLPTVRYPGGLREEVKA